MTTNYSPTGYRARFTGTHTLDVAAWHPETGEAMVVDPKEGRLRPVRSYHNFSSLEQVSKIVGVLPGGGWYWATRDNTTGEVYRMDVVGWIVDDHGSATPMAADSRTYTTGTVGPDNMPHAVLVSGENPERMLKISGLWEGNQ